MDSFLTAGVDARWQTPTEILVLVYWAFVQVTNRYIGSKTIMRDVNSCTDLFFIRFILYSFHESVTRDCIIWLKITQESVLLM